MSSSSTTSSNFEALFNAALAKYTEQTGKDLRNHFPAHQIERCNTPESLLAVFKEQAKTFDEFRNGDHRLINWLQSIVNHLDALSSSAALSSAAIVVSPYRAGLLLFYLLIDVLL
jgi:fungal STAND N-terminal Goodbye domain